MPKTTTRQGRRQERRDNYLGGRSRRSHTHYSTSNASLEENGRAETRRDFQGVCSQCRPILSKYAGTFKGLIHQGSDLKKRKHANPHPKRTDLTHYRDIKVQNDWIRENLFDPMGNYLFCCSCIRASLQLSKHRIAHQRAIKRKQSQEPLRDMTKSAVEAEHLSDYVVMPESCEMAFKEWWGSLQASNVVSVRYPHARHGNAGRASNSCKTSVMEDYLTFVDANSQPNGRSIESSGPTFYFISKFLTLQTPESTCSHYPERLRRSVVGEFNRAQREAGRGECSNGSCHNWLKRHRPKHSICPHQADYCDTCAQQKADIKAKQTTMNRLQQASVSLPEDLQKLMDEITALKQTLEIHRQEAQESHHYYVEITKKCSTKWNRILELQAKLTLDEDEQDELEVLKRSFSLVLAVDYQMAKLVPYWGHSPQPGSTYYLQKMSHDVFGIVNHGTNASTVYLFDERVGPKNTDHTVSYTTHYISELPDWIRRIHIFMDNTSSTNKNRFMMAWALEMISQKKLDFLRISFLIAGHTKFSPDILFAKITQTYNRSDVFNTGELQEVIATHAQVVIDQGELVREWRTNLSKYSELPGIRGLHDFVFATHPTTGRVVCKVRRLCHTGDFETATIRGQAVDDDVIPDASASYLCKNLLRQLSDTKLGHLRQMSRSFIPIDRHLPFL